MSSFTCRETAKPTKKMRGWKRIELTPALSFSLGRSQALKVPTNNQFHLEG